MWFRLCSGCTFSYVTAQSDSEENRYRGAFFSDIGFLDCYLLLRLSLSWAHTVKIHDTRKTQNSIAHVSTSVQSCERSSFSAMCGTDRSLVLRLAAQWELVPSSGSRHGSCSALKWFASRILLSSLQFAHTISTHTIKSHSVCSFQFLTH